MCRRASCCAAVLLLAVGAHAQFGNANVQWDSNAQPSVKAPGSVPTRDHVAPPNARRTGLMQLPVATLTEILASLNAECPTCQSHGHFVSRIRAACLAMGPKALKAQLAKRGLRCDGCTMREHYMDRVLDTVHLSPKQ